MEQSRNGQRRSRVHALWATLICLAAITAIGCDTVAEITFIKENLNTVTTLGFRSEICHGDPPSGACLPPGCGTLDFVMETNRSNFVRPNMQLEGLDGRLVPGGNFGDSSDIEFNGSWLFQLDDGMTAGSMDVDPSRVGRDKQCTAATDCAAGFTCKVFETSELPSNAAHLEGDFYVNGNTGLCVAPAQVTWAAGSLRYTSIDDDPQPDNDATSALGFRGLTLAVEMDNSGSLDGLNESGFIDPDTKTDPNVERSKAIKIFVAELFDEDRSGLLGRSEISLSGLNGNSVNGVTDVFKIDQSFQSSFITDAQATAKARNSNQSAFDKAIDDLRGPLGGKTPLWEALIQSAEFFAQESTRVVTSSYARRAIAFTDGTSDGSIGNANAETTLQSLATVNAEASIIHLDSLTPTIDKLERTGPLADYERVACKTGGYYAYDVWPDSLEDHFRRQSKSYEARWSIDTEVTVELSDGSAAALSQLPFGWYRLGSSMVINLGERSRTYNLFAEKSLFGLNGEYTDSRLLFYVPDPSASSSN